MALYFTQIERESASDIHCCIFFCVNTRSLCAHSLISTFKKSESIREWCTKRGKIACAHRHDIKIHALACYLYFTYISTRVVHAAFQCFYPVCISRRKRKDNLRKWEKKRTRWVKEMLCKFVAYIFLYFVDWREVDFFRILWDLIAWQNQPVYIAKKDYKIAINFKL